MKAKRLFSHFGHVIWKNKEGYFTVAKGDGTDEIFETIEQAMKYIEEIENIK